MEFDERTATTVETYKVGDTIKVLRKKYSSWQVSWGVIVGFANFKDHPSIEILTISDPEYSSAEVEILTFNSETENVEIAPANEYEPAFNRSKVIERFDKMIREKENEISVLQRKKNAFIRYFGTDGETK